MQNLTVSKDNDHLGTSARGGQQTSQSLDVTYQKDFITKEMGKYQINDKDEEKQIFGSSVTLALNAAQLTLGRINVEVMPEQ